MTLAKARGVGIARGFLKRDLACESAAASALEAEAADPGLMAATSQAEGGATKSFGSRVRILEVVMRWAR